MSDFQVSHGVAVAVDIALSSAVAFELDLLSLEDRNRILRSLRNSGLPICFPRLTAENCVKALDEIEAHRGGHLNLVVPSGIGRVLFITEKRSLPSSVLQRALRFLDQAASERAFFVPVSSSVGQAAWFD